MADQPDAKVTPNLKAIQLLWNHGREQWTQWRDLASECRRFTRGRQWTAEQVEANNASGRHSLTINIMTRLFRALGGAQRQNRRDVLVEARRGGHPAVAAVLTALAKHTMQLRSNQGQHAISDAFDNGLRTGKGWIGQRIDFTDDPFTGDLIIDAPHPLMVTEDPAASEYDLSDAKYIDVARAIDKELLHAKHREKLGKYKRPADQDDDYSHQFIMAISGAQEVVEDYMDPEDIDTDQEDINAHRYIVHETFRRVPCRRVGLLEGESLKAVLFDPSSKDSRRQAAVELNKIAGDILAQLPPEIMDGKPDQRLADACKWLAENQPERFSYADIWTNRIERTLWVGNVELEYDKDVMPGKNIIPVFRFAPYHDGNKVMGVMEMLVDPQKELNKRRSQLLNILNQTANAGWIVKTATKAALRRLMLFGSSPQVFKKTDYGGDEPKKIEPNKLPEAFLTMANQAFGDSEYITGMNSAVLGQEADSQESGVAQDQRRRQGMTVLEPIYENLDRTTGAFALCLIETIRTRKLYSRSEVMQLIREQDLIDSSVIEQAEAELGPEIDAMLAEAERPAPQQPDPLRMNMMLPEHQQAAMAAYQQEADDYEQARMAVLEARATELTLDLIDDWATGRYGVVVTESPEAPVERFANRAELAALAEAGIPVPPDVMVDATGLPAHVKDRIKEYQGELAQQQAQPALSTALRT